MKNRLCKTIVICSLGSSFYFFDYFFQVTPSVLTNQLMQYFHIDASGIGILGGGFFAAYAIMQIPAGILLDRFGARLLLTLAAIISGFGLLLFANTPVFGFAVLGRVLIGLGSAFSFVCAIHLIANWFNHRYFAPLTGAVQLSAALGSMLGLAPIAWAVTQWPWQQVLTCMSTATFLLSILFWAIIRNHPSGKTTTFAHHRSRLLDGLLFLRQRPRLLIIFTVGFLSWMPVSSIGALWGVPYLALVLHISTIAASNLCNWFWLGLGIGSLCIGLLSQHLLSRKTPIILCYTCALIASILLLNAIHLNIPLIMIALFLLGFSAGTQALSFSLLKDNCPKNIFGSLSGINNMAAIIGGGIAQFSIGFILHSQWNGTRLHHIPVYSLHNYQTALLLLPIAALAGLIISIVALKETHCQMQTELFH